MRSRTDRHPRLRASATLTTRGSSVLAAALAAGVGSFALGETDLLRVAVVLVIVCLLTWLIAALIGARVRTTYLPDRPEAAVSTTLGVRVTASFTRKLPPSSLVCHADTDAGLSSTPHLRVPGDAAGRGVRLDMQTTIQARGTHTLGPLELTMRDPLGLVSTTYRDTTTCRIVGLPRHHGVHRAWLRRIGAVPRAADPTEDDGIGGEPDVGVREHHPEDGLRRIHWRSTARTGRLMTRLDHPESSRSATIAYESRADHQEPRTFERTLEIVASIGVELLGRGWNLRLIDSAGLQTAPGGSWSPASLLRHLAAATTAEEASPPDLFANGDPAVLVTTDPRQHNPDSGFHTIVLPLRAADIRPARGLSIIERNADLAAVLAAEPRAEAHA